MNGSLLLKGKNAIVTGCAQGIGQVLAGHARSHTHGADVPIASTS